MIGYVLPCLGYIAPSESIEESVTVKPVILPRLRRTVLLMMIEDETLAAATAIIRNLAKRAAPPYDSPDYKLASMNGSTIDKQRLPGSESVTKRSFEKELSALQARIQYLEAKASTVEHNLPDTPNESAGLPTSPFGPQYIVQSEKGVYPVRQRSVGAARISNLLAARENGHEGCRSFSEEDLGHLREHVQKQAEEIKSQRETIASVSERLNEQQEHAQRTFVKVEHEDISKLQRELQKHQQANEAFQKALKEIGTIITNVAKGDLSHKVLIHNVEMDPEITTFKRTINQMMDQLQVFGSEVSRVAREVGTEGKLGGQAQISGVNGIWKELTENG